MRDIFDVRCVRGNSPRSMEERRYAFDPDRYLDRLGHVVRHALVASSAGSTHFEERTRLFGGFENMGARFGENIAQFHAHEGGSGVA